MTKKIYGVTRVDPEGHQFTDKYAHYAWIYAPDYEDIFGAKRKLTNGSYVKIEHGSKCIYRAIETTGTDDVNSETIGLSYNSLCDLGIDPRNTDDTKVTISPSCTYNFLRHHPDEAQKLPYRIALFSLCVGILSLALGVICLIITIVG